MDDRSLHIPLSCNEAVARLMQELTEAGFRVERSFDLQSARGALRAPESCACPHHGTAQCSCQYVVLLVSRSEGAPLSLIAHGQDLTTHITLESAHDSNGEGTLVRRIASELSKATAPQHSITQEN